MAITNMLTGVEYKLGQGTYSYAADIATGPIVIQRSRDNGASYENMTDGSFAATVDGTISISEDFMYKATVPSGDYLSLSLTMTGYS